MLAKGVVTTAVEMNELDKKIISLLQADGRASNAKIAREVGVSEGDCASSPSSID